MIYRNHHTFLIQNISKSRILEMFPTRELSLLNNIKWSTHMLTMMWIRCGMMAKETKHNLKTFFENRKESLQIYSKKTWGYISLVLSNHVRKIFLKSYEWQETITDTFLLSSFHSFFFIFFCCLSLHLLFFRLIRSLCHLSMSIGEQPGNNKN